jgi:sulfofructosephosphate aldolase
VTPTLDALARDSGTFLMVAMDQRESLRTMIAEQVGGRVPDERLVAFKLAVARELGPYASGFLIDRHYGFADVVHGHLLPPTCGLILAADALVQSPGSVVEDTDVDVGIDPGGAVALKLLVIWRDDEDRARRLETSRRFVQLATAHGLLSVLEGIVRVAEDVRDEAIVEAASELSGVGPSLYKVEVPMRGRGDPAEIVRRCREIDTVVPMPWVVLSNGVELADFPSAVEAACRAGASGMLAGRAIWSDLVASDDPAALLRERAVPRLQQLSAIVDAHGRPWREKVP